MRWVLTQINMKQTFTKYLPCARPLATYKTTTVTTKHSPCPHGALEPYMLELSVL